jgi:hypothetical protein
MSRRPRELITKDPSSIEPQGFDWTLYLAELGASVTISTSAWEVSPDDDDGLTLSGASIVGSSLKTVVTLTGGVLGTTYNVTNRIVTSSGVTDDRSFRVRIANR